jgi:trimeric autotransporter adhesin
MSVIDQLGLRQDPFGPAGVASDIGIAAPMAAAFGQLRAAVRRGDPLIVLVGRPGMGKTLLLTRLEAAVRAEGAEVRSIPRGDMAHLALNAPVELLLVDEADTMTPDTLRALAPGSAAATATTMVFASTRPDLHRLAGAARTTIVDLRPLGVDEAADFLTARAAAAGRPDLFAPGAIETIAAAGRGSPRLLRVLAGAAMFQAASDGAAQIAPAHASLAATMHGSLIGAAAPAIGAPANDAVRFVRPAEGGHPADNVVPLFAPPAPRRRRVGVLPVAASIALVALMLPASFAPSGNVPSTAGEAQAASAVPGPVRLAAAAFTVAPANAAATFASAGRFEARWIAPLRVAALPVTGAPRPLAAAAADVPVVRLPPAELADLAPSVAVRRPDVRLPAPDAREVLADLLAAARVRPVADSDDRRRRGDAADEGFEFAAAVAPVRESIEAAASAAGRPAAIPALPTVDVARPLTKVESIRTVPEPVRLAKANVEDARAVKAVAEPAKAAKEAAKQAADDAKAVKRSAEEAKAARVTADEANLGKETARQAKAAKEAADGARATKAAAELAKAAKDSAAQAKAVKAAADQAKEAADTAKAAKEAAEQAKAAKDAAGQAKAAKDAAEQAKAAKDAVNAARTAKEATEQVKAAKEAADAAKLAKEAAEQAKAAKDAVEGARAAKDAADQAKAAKEAADTAKAAKDAAEQAKAAKDAAEQARAAKDAADQAKAVKEAADLAKAAKDAADQAKAVKDAAKAAKDTAKATKDLTKGLRGG